MQNKQLPSLPEQHTPRSATLCVRLTEQEHQRIYDFARQHNVQVSRLVRHFVLKAIQHYSEKTADETD